MARNLFAGLKTAKANADANYMLSGNFWVRVDRNKATETRSRVPFLVAELTVIKIIGSFQDRKTHSIGEEVSHMFMSDSDYFMSDLKKFLAGAFGVRVEQVDDSDGLMAWGQKADANGNMMDDLDAAGQIKQPMRGMVLEYNNRIQTSDKKDEATGLPKEYVRTKVMREVPPEEVVRGLPSTDKERFFPNLYLESLIKDKAAATTAPKAYPLNL